jgi:hypothetical protein
MTSWRPCDGVCAASLRAMGPSYRRLFCFQRESCNRKKRGREHFARLRISRVCGLISHWTNENNANPK